MSRKLVAEFLASEHADEALVPATAREPRQTTMPDRAIHGSATVQSRPSSKLLAWSVGATTLVGALCFTTIIILEDVKGVPDWRSIAEQSTANAIASVLSADPQTLTWGNVMLHHFGKDNERGVCGLVIPVGNSDTTWTDFVIKVRRADAAKTEVYLTDGINGVRDIYIARQRYCRDDGARPQPIFR